MKDAGWGEKEHLGAGLHQRLEVRWTGGEWLRNSTVKGDSSLIGALVTQMRSNVKRVNKECRERWQNLSFS